MEFFAESGTSARILIRGGFARVGSLADVYKADSKNKKVVLYINCQYITIGICREFCMECETNQRQR
ncbi:MAG TPA: hypothetical protein VF493_20240 [Terriglobales bacterium]